MNELPPIMRDQRKIDADHLRLLAIFHFILAGFAVVGIGFLFLHYTFMHTLMNPEMWRNAKQAGPPPPSPEQFFAIFKWFYILFGIWALLGGIANLISGLCLRQRKGRIFSLIVAGLNILHFPFGSVLGVFTFIVLLRASVREIYDAQTGVSPVALPPVSAT